MKFDNVINEVKIDVLYKHYKSKGKSILNTKYTGDRLQGRDGKMLTQQDYIDQYQDKYPEADFTNYVSDVIKRQEFRQIDHSKIQQGIKNDQKNKNKEVSRGLSLPKKKIS